MRCILMETMQPIGAVPQQATMLDTEHCNVTPHLQQLQIRGPNELQLQTFTTCLKFVDLVTDVFALCFSLQTLLRSFARSPRVGVSENTFVCVFRTRGFGSRCFRFVFLIADPPVFVCAFPSPLPFVCVPPCVEASNYGHLTSFVFHPFWHFPRRPPIRLPFFFFFLFAETNGRTHGL